MRASTMAAGSAGCAQHSRTNSWLQTSLRPPSLTGGTHHLTSNSHSRMRRRACSNTDGSACSKRFSTTTSSTTTSTSSGGSSSMDTTYSPMPFLPMPPELPPSFTSSVVLPVSRRSATLGAAALLIGTSGAHLVPSNARASKLPEFADNAWEAIGGGPSDLYFPESWLGVWDVQSTLVKVETPLGQDMTPDGGKAVERARTEDLNKQDQYRVSFMRAPNGRVIYDRRYNTAKLMETYYGEGMDFMGRISWNPADPNVLRLSMPKGVNVRTRVTRRSENESGPDKLDTSEFIEQIYDNSSTGTPRIKASQCFTKYKWRSEDIAAKDGGPAIVATQVVSDYLTAYDGEQRFMQAMNRPVATFTYRMAFTRHHDAAHMGAALAVS